MLLTAEPQDNFFCVIPPSLAAKYEFKCIEIGLFPHDIVVMVREETRSRLVCVAGGILVPGVLSWRRSCHAPREASCEAARENPACHISYEF